MIKIIVKRFIPDYNNVADESVRESYAVVSGILGIICNISLFIAKLIIGLATSSIAILSDAFNNFSDLGSSLVVIFGVKLSNHPADTEHPHGHGRFEYIGALVVAFIIFAVGLQLLRTSVGKILQPEVPQLNPWLLVILIGSVLVKVWMFSYNRYIAKLINSSINQATAYDSINDVFATSTVIIGVLLSKYTNFPIDGVMGLAISVLIIYTGFNIAKSAVSLLLGPSPCSELVKEITEIATNEKDVIGVHDLLLHDYGPGRLIGSLHVVVPDELDIIEAHSLVDRIEEKIRGELNIDIVIHVDPQGRDKMKGK